MRRCLPGKHRGGVTSALSSSELRPPPFQGEGGVKSKRVLVLIFCLYFLLPWGIKVAPGNPGKSRTRTRHPQREGLCHPFFLPEFYLSPRLSLLYFCVDEVQKGLSKISLFSNVPLPLSLPNLYSQAKRHSIEA